MCYTVVEAPQRYGRWCEAQFIVGQLETDSSKGAIMCRVWDCLQLRAVKTPDTSIKKDLLQEVFFYWLGKKFGGFFRRKNQNLGGVLRPPIKCRVPNFKKKCCKRYSIKGLGHFFFGDFLATFLDVSATFQGRCQLEVYMCLT